MKQVFVNEINYATETKVFGQTNQQISRYYNPLVVIGIKRKARIGCLDWSTATTCHAERTNLSVWTFTCRFTRCTIGYIIKLDNLRFAVAVFVCHFNCCRKHSAYGKMSAKSAGLTDHIWTINEIMSATT